MNLSKLLIMIAGATGWDSVSFGNITTDDFPSTFADATNDNMAVDVKKLDVNKVLIAYSYYSLANVGGDGIMVAQIDPNTGVVTFGTPVSYGTMFDYTDANTPYYMFGDGIAVLSTTSFVLGWTNLAGEGKCRAATVSGTTITLNAAVTNIQTTSAVSIRYVNVCALNATTVMFIYRVWGSTGIRASLHTVSGTVMTYRSNILISGFNPYSLSIKRIDDTRALVSLGGGLAGYNMLRVLTYSGNTISAGTAFTINAGIVDDISFVLFDTSNFAAFFEFSGVLHFCRYSISGTTITQASAAFVNYSSKMPVFTYSARSNVYGSGFEIIKQEGSSYILASCSHVGTSVNDARPYLYVFRFTPATDSITLISKTYLRSVDTTYTRWGSSYISFQFDVLNDKFLVMFGFFQQGGTSYTMKLIKVRV